MNTYQVTWRNENSKLISKTVEADSPSDAMQTVWEDGHFYDKAITELSVQGFSIFRKAGTTGLYSGDYATVWRVS